MRRGRRRFIFSLLSAERVYGIQFRIQYLRNFNESNPLPAAFSLPQDTSSEDLCRHLRWGIRMIVEKTDLGSLPEFRSGQAVRRLIFTGKDNRHVVLGVLTGGFKFRDGEVFHLQHFMRSLHVAEIRIGKLIYSRPGCQDSRLREFLVHHVCCLFMQENIIAIRQVVFRRKDVGWID